MADLIDRQAAIDAIDVLCQEHRYKIPGKRETYSQYNEAWQDALDRAEGAIFNLPSVQPNHIAESDRKVSISCGQENDLISRQAAIDAIEKAKMAQTPDGEIYAAKYNAEMNIQLLPTIQPEIVRCKDCKYMIDTGDDLMCDNAKGWVVATTSDFGCVLAERRTDG